MLAFIFRPLQAVVLSLVMVLAMTPAGCFDSGPLSKLDSTLDYAPLFFRGLVISNVITDAQATKYLAGVTQFESAADETKTCLSNAATSSQKFACYTQLGDRAKAIVVQFYPDADIGGNMKVAQYVLLVKDIVTLIIRKNSPTVGQSTSADIDKELSDKIDELNRLLKSEAR